MGTADRSASRIPLRSRGRVIVHDPKALLTLLAGGVMALVVVTVIGFSGAYFTVQSVSPMNSISAGEVVLQLSDTGAIVDGSGLKPGVTRSGNQTITNKAERARVFLGASGFPEAPGLADEFEVVVRQTSPAVTDPVYDGSLRGLRDASLGTFAPDEKRTYSVELTWPASHNDQALQGASVSFQFDWFARSVP
jgi:hypothetical protein